MTRPSEVKPREGDQPGTPYEIFEIGAELPDMAFSITPEINTEYLEAIDEQEKNYSLNGRNVCAPNVLSVYLLAVLYRRYPPIQGIVVYDQLWKWRSPIFADETTDLIASGKVTEKFEKRGRKWLRFSAQFRKTDGTIVAEANHTLHLPE
ncbi:MAG: hypothetical protein ACTIKR_11425 [Advenella sp.]|uniref:MaoC-like domain-containing protein n=1 Tax=Advenella kashmirensis TaxID=310575 RepID=A0A356LAE9_9BURK|nr:hypothetical protein [Advenella sp. FME57]HBP27967.1 hypothetical protein [Advenella kashmirensis]